MDETIFFTVFFVWCWGFRALEYVPCRLTGCVVMHAWRIVFESDGLDRPCIIANRPGTSSLLCLVVEFLHGQVQCVARDIGKHL
jgi:hypothetical protein